MNAILLPWRGRHKLFFPRPTHPVVPTVVPAAGCRPAAPPPPPPPPAVGRWPSGSAAVGASKAGGWGRGGTKEGVKLYSLK